MTQYFLNFLVSELATAPHLAVAHLNRQSAKLSRFLSSHSRSAATFWTFWI